MFPCPSLPLEPLPQHCTSRRSRRAKSQWHRLWSGDQGAKEGEARKCGAGKQGKPSPARRERELFSRRMHGRMQGRDGGRLRGWPTPPHRTGTARQVQLMFRWSVLRLERLWPVRAGAHASVPPTGPSRSVPLGRTLSRHQFSGAARCPPESRSTRHAFHQQWKP